LKKTLILHLGAHLSFSFLYGLIYFIINPNWTGIIGFCLSMLFGFFIDADHYLINKPRLKQFWQALKNKKFTLGDPTPERVNYMHTWEACLLINLATWYLILVCKQSVGYIILASYWTHFIIDVLDCENQVFPKNNPAQTSVHIFLWNKSKLFHKFCFNAPDLNKIWF